MQYRELKECTFRPQISKPPTPKNQFAGLPLGHLPSGYGDLASPSNEVPAPHRAIVNIEVGKEKDDQYLKKIGQLYGGRSSRQSADYQPLKVNPNRIESLATPKNQVALKPQKSKMRHADDSAISPTSFKEE